MCDRLQWGTEEMLAAEMELEVAVAKTFDLIYGTDVDDLAAWQKLHRTIHDSAVPSDLETCRDVSNSLPSHNSSYLWLKLCCSDTGRDNSILQHL